MEDPRGALGQKRRGGRGLGSLVGKGRDGSCEQEQLCASAALGVPGELECS